MTAKTLELANEAREKILKDYPDCEERIRAFCLDISSPSNVANFIMDFLEDA